MDSLRLASLKPETLTWDVALRLFLLRCKSKNLSVRTQGLYTEKLRNFRKWIEPNGADRPAAVESGHLRAFLGAYKTRGVSDLTVDAFYRILATFWRFLERDGLVLVNPMGKVERPRREQRFAKPVTEHQLRLILQTMDTRDVLGLRDYTLTLLLADTGLRLSEALAMKLSDIDWATNSMVVMGKGRKERRVAFGQTARKALLNWSERRGTIEGSETLWLNRMGGPMQSNNFQQRMKKHTRAAGISERRLSPHALRHFFALQFLRNGGDVMTLQKLLGHTSLDMVRNYVSMTDEDSMAAHRRASPLDKMGPLPNERKQVWLK